MAPLLGMTQMAAPVYQTAVGEGQGKAGSQKVARMQLCDHMQLQGRWGEAGSFGCPESSEGRAWRAEQCPCRGGCVLT